jgi:hypothetical protein
MSPVESKYLSALCAGWPRDAISGTVMVNATEVGNRLSLSEGESKAVIHALREQGFLHVREIEDVLLIHPTQAGIDCVQAGGVG